MTSQHRASSGPSSRSSQPERTIFTAQLWRAVGLHPRQLSIPRVHFFPDETTGAPSMPVPSSSSRGSVDRAGWQGRPSNQQQQHTEAPQHKRRRSSVMHYQQEEDDASDLPSCSGAALQGITWQPDLDAIMHAPRRPRTTASRRRLRSLHRFAAEIPLPSFEEQASPAASMHFPAPSPTRPPSQPELRTEYVGDAAAHQQVPLEWVPPAHQHPHPTAQHAAALTTCQLEAQQPQLCSRADEQREHTFSRKAHAPPQVLADLPCHLVGGTETTEKRTSAKGSPASHSAESSLGVFADLQDTEQRDVEVDADLASPGTQPHHASKSEHHRQQQQQQRTAAWGRSSPLSSDDVF